MAEFRFRLQTLLKIRRTNRDQRRMELAEAYQAEEVLRRQLEEVSQEMRDLAEISRKASEPGTINVDSLLAAHRYELILAAQEKLIIDRTRKLAVEVQRRREALAEADKEVRVLEKLEEQQRSRLLAQENRQESKQMDDIAGRLWRAKEPS